MQKPLKNFSKQDIKIQNNLPYSLMVEYCPENKVINQLYFKFTDSEGNRLYWQVVHVEDVESFTKIPNMKSDLPGILEIHEVHNGFALKVTEYEIKIPNVVLGQSDLKIAVPNNSRINLHRDLELVERYYGKSAYDSITKLKFAGRDWYDPQHDIIHVAQGGRNMIHELIHASRKSLLMASKNGKYWEKLEMIEEFFAEGVSDQIKGLHSSHLYNFDFYINDISLSTENLQSTWGGVGFIEQCRYFLLSAAFWKLNWEYNRLTGKYLAKEFNSIYYTRLQSGEKPSLDMFLSIISCLLPKIEGFATRIWLQNKPLFSTKIVEGDKIWLYVQDYQARDENLGIATIYSYKTFPNGDDWIDQERGLKYNKNGSPIEIEIDKIDERGVIKMHRVETTISEFNGGFGYVKLYLHDKLESPVSEELMGNEPFPQVFNFHCSSGAYRIKINGKEHFRYLGDDVSNTKTIVTSKALILQIKDLQTGKLIPFNNKLKNIVFFENDLNKSGRLVEIKTVKKTYQRIIKNGKNHLFLP